VESARVGAAEGTNAVAVQDEQRATPQLTVPRGHRWWLWYLCCGLSVVAVGPFLPNLIQQALYAALGASVFVAVAVGLRLHRPARPLAWRVLLLAIGCAVVANLIWAAMTVAGVPIPGFSAVDVVYYSMYPLLALALAILPVHGRYSSPMAGMTEAGIITCTAAVLWWTVLVDPLVVDHGALPKDADFIAYPVLDLMLLAMAVRLLLVTGARAPSYLLLVGSAAALLAADTVYFVVVARTGDVTGPQFSSLTWLLANALFGAGALHPSMRSVAAEGHADARRDRLVALPVYVLLVVLTPIITGVSLVLEMGSEHFDVYDVAIPLGATTLTAVLLVLRLRQLTAVAQMRATDLNTRTVDLEGALHSQAVLQQELSHRALHDPLTGLPNRLLLHGRIGAALERRADGALLMVDIDGFKDVNDRFGHAMGDDLLLAVAQRISDLIGPAHLLARPGGDEFAVLLEDVDCDTVRERGDAVVAAMRRPVTVRGHDLYATVSAGVRTLDPSGLTVDMLRDADLALHAAKAAGRDQLVVYDEALREQRAEKRRTVERLRSAIGNEELVVHYQPMVRLADERFQAVEALVRWCPPGEAMVPPDMFIPAAEDSGLIVALGEWVLRQSCRDAVSWNEQHGTLLSVNVSPRQLREQDFVAVVQRALADSGFPADALILEITESVLVGSGAQTEQTIDHLSRLRRDGVRVAVDDFGTGYSSLAYLRDLPIDFVKIDRSFMPTGAPGADHLVTLVRAIVDLASGLGLGTVAEGIETPEQAQLLRELGCERAQGFYFAGPAPADEVSATLAGSVVVPSV
jgi:diguanylate cyclase (GGDEF)-like protein